MHKYGHFKASSLYVRAKYFSHKKDMRVYNKLTYRILIVNFVLEPKC